MTKTCTKCGDTKPLDEYHKHKSRKDGHGSRCKECIRAYQQANREKFGEQKRAYYAANREKISEQRRAYREANREKLNEKERAYREEVRDFRNRDNSQRKREQNNLTHLTATRNGQPWEQWEDDFITNHPEMTNYQIATHIGRTYASTHTRKFRLRKKGVLAQ